MFTLTKWYLDLVTDEGAAIVGYSARLESGPVGVGYSSVLLSVAHLPAREECAFGDSECPRDDGEFVTWHHPALDVRGSWRRLAAPFAERLIQLPDGELRWNCVMPRSRAEIDLGGTHHSGVGYVEQLTLTLPPWRLPFNHLRWGRHASPYRSIIWIAWRGADERLFIWDNGVPQPGAVLDERGIHGLTEGAELVMGEPRDVCARPALARLVDRLPSAARPLAKPLGAMFEHKMVAPSRVVSATGPVDSGWSLFEEVQW